MAIDGVFASPKQRIFIVNATANLGRALSGSLENLLLPLILLWLLSRDAYGVWAVVFSVSTYVTYLDLGLQGAVQANVARWAASNDTMGAWKIAWAGVKLVLGVGGVAFCCLLVVASLLHSVFPAVPASLVRQGALALIILTIGQVANLSINVLSSYYAGHQRSVLPSVVMSLARLISLLSIVSVGLAHPFLPLLAAAYSIPLALGFGVLVTAFWQESRRLRGVAESFRPIEIKGTRAGHLLSYSGPLMVWNVCTLVVSAAGTAIVGRVDFSSVAIYSISTMFVLSIAGVDNAVMSPLLSELGRQVSRGDRAALGRTVLSSSRINAVILSILMVCACGAAAVLETFGQLNGAGAIGSFVIVGLIVASSVRLTMTPMTFGFVASGSHRRVVFQPVIEAGLNLGASTVLGLAFGVLGVVLGGLIAGIVGAGLAILWSRRAAGFADVIRACQITKAVALPLVCALPAIAVSLAVHDVAALGLVPALCLVTLSLVVSLGLTWLLAVPSTTRRALVHRLFRPQPIH